MEPRGLGLDALCQTWLANLPSTLPQEITVQFSALFDTYLCSGKFFLFVNEVSPFTSQWRWWQEGGVWGSTLPHDQHGVFLCSTVRIRHLSVLDKVKYLLYEVYSNGESNAIIYPHTRWMRGGKVKVIDLLRGQGIWRCYGYVPSNECVSSTAFADDHDHHGRRRQQRPRLPPPVSTRIHVSDQALGSFTVVRSRQAVVWMSTAAAAAAIAVSRSHKFCKLDVLILVKFSEKKNPAAPDLTLCTCSLPRVSAEFIHAALPPRPPPLTTIHTTYPDAIISFVLAWVRE